MSTCSSHCEYRRSSSQGTYSCLPACLMVSDIQGQAGALNSVDCTCSVIPNRETGAWICAMVLIWHWFFYELASLLAQIDLLDAVQTQCIYPFTSLLTWAVLKNWERGGMHLGNRRAGSTFSLGMVQQQLLYHRRAPIAFVCPPNWKW